ncbi:hypothetical protein [Ornithinibacillus halotolerans]|uniref:Peptidyl-prolyl cis-trans isomerase n=1 Tax=Ornithinibacillus halotolerans TaxID=1274357 RepID=A0A916S697_9BACI|nr:hypothetical protein [Ornithinibacillus halotolerans]GGA83626.1 hypothetical protein GCM10008025_28410 [Ornithinibacillus halotolerans]
MIVPILGNVTYQITLDPTVWIFDDRKIILEEAFSNQETNEEIDEAKLAAERWEKAITTSRQARPPVNKSLTKHERENILKYSYVMPINDFLDYAEIKDGSNTVSLKTETGDVNLTLEELYNSYLLFAIDGQPLKEDGPVHLIFKDGSNKKTPIKGINKIIIN